MGNVGAFQPQLTEDADEEMAQPPELMLAMVVENDGKQTLALPASLREKWASDPIRKDEWLHELQTFDARQLTSSHNLPVPRLSSESLPKASILAQVWGDGGGANSIAKHAGG